VEGPCEHSNKPSDCVTVCTSDVTYLAVHSEEMSSLFVVEPIGTQLKTSDFADATFPASTVHQLIISLHNTSLQL
jgi:hypothetical protein